MVPPIPPSNNSKRNVPRKNWLHFPGDFTPCPLQATAIKPLEAVSDAAGEENPLVGSMAVRGAAVKPPTFTADFSTESMARVAGASATLPPTKLVRCADEKRDPGLPGISPIDEDDFPDGAFVRLQNRAKKTYLAADEDGRNVSLRPQPQGGAFSPNAVWRLQRVDVGGAAFVLLQGVAYGRYLAIAPPGYRGRRASQRDYESLNLDHHNPFIWLADRVEAGQNHVLLRNYDQCYLRANGRRLFSNNHVTVDAWNGSLTTMMQWTVEAIPSTPVPLPLPPPPQHPIHVKRGLFKRRTEREHPGRRIRHMRLDDDGNFVRDHWPEFRFFDNSVSNLRTEVAHREDVENITLCVRAGVNALVTPIVTNLPNNVDPIEIIVYTTGSPAAAGLRYPQFDQTEA